MGGVEWHPIRVPSSLLPNAGGVTGFGTSTSLEPVRFADVISILVLLVFFG